MRPLQTDTGSAPPHPRGAGIYVAPGSAGRCALPVPFAGLPDPLDNLLVPGKGYIIGNGIVGRVQIAPAPLGDGDFAADFGPDHRLILVHQAGIDPSYSLLPPDSPPGKINDAGIWWVSLASVPAIR